MELFLHLPCVQLDATALTDRLVHGNGFVKVRLVFRAGQIDKRLEQVFGAKPAVGGRHEAVEVQDGHDMPVERADELLEGLWVARFSNAMKILVDIKDHRRWFCTYRPSTLLMPAFLARA